MDFIINLYKNINRDIDFDFIYQELSLIDESINNKYNNLADQLKKLSNNEEHYLNLLSLKSSTITIKDTKINMYFDKLIYENNSLKSCIMFYYNTRQIYTIFLPDELTKITEKLYDTQDDEIKNKLLKKSKQLKEIITTRSLVRGN